MNILFVSKAIIASTSTVAARWALAEGVNNSEGLGVFGELIFSESMALNKDSTAVALVRVGLILRSDGLREGLRGIFNTDKVQESWC